VGSHLAEILVGGYQLRSRATTLQIQRHRELQGVQCSECAFHSMVPNERLCLLEMTAGQQHHLEPAPGKVRKEQAA